MLQESTFVSNVTNLKTRSCLYSTSINIVEQLSKHNFFRQELGFERLLRSVDGLLYDTNVFLPSSWGFEPFLLIVSPR